MKYTKGGWGYCGASPEEGCSCGLIWSVAQDAVVAIAIREDESGKRPHEQMVANAHLIAQSPRMYELLKKLVDISFETDDENYDELRPLLEEANEIIQTHD